MAIFKWLCAEQENEATNDRLLITSEEYNILPRVAFGNFTGWCRDFIRDIIGDVPPVDALIGAFSGGASTSRPRTRSHPATKYLGEAHATSSGLELFGLISDEMPGWIGAGYDLRSKIVPGNVMFTVPKKTDIDRCACKEPDLNMFVQKGLGDFISHRLLRKTGINLNDQSINRSLAHLGSVTNELSTLDLSSASDSVTEGLVSLLLPECWYTILDAARCRMTIIDGDEHQNHMFSSMGNGFTFELESLLFYTLARATAYFTRTKGTISVYGDDIICPRAMSQDLIMVLNYFGFQVNTQKSCIEGPFRESCGGHYHLGVDITPFFIKGPIETLPDLIHLANSLREWASTKEPLDDSRPWSVEILDVDVEEIWLWLKSFVPRCLWGGVDTTFKYQLVSHDTPSHRLYMRRKKRSTGEGGYLHWLNTTWNRNFESDGISTSEMSIETHKVELRKVRHKECPRLRRLFLSELESSVRGVTG